MAMVIMKNRICRQLFLIPQDVVPHSCCSLLHSRISAQSNNKINLSKGKNIASCLSSKSTYATLPFVNTSIKDSPLVTRLYNGIIGGNRGALAQSITLVESTHPIKKLLAQELLNKILEINHEKTLHSVEQKSFRIGLTGPPGTGKSTFIETFGKLLTSLGHKVAVLAVDPSSSRTGGSLLGDKTRMQDLTVDPNAYIRPSPACGTLGGVTRSTNDAIVLCEAAGYNIILVETMGVGQSEFAVADMVDLFCLLIPPAGGDELQGFKKGIVEIADLIVVNKADGSLLPAARRIQAEYISALKLLPKKKSAWKTKVLRMSAKTKEGIPELWIEMQNFQKCLIENGIFEMKRQQQLKIWMWNQIKFRLFEIFQNQPGMKDEVENMENKVLNRVITPGCAADILLSEYMKNLR